MKARLLGRTGLAITAALALVMTGCATDTDPDSDTGAGAGAETGADEPTLALAASTDALAETSFRFELEMGEMMSATGAIDPAAGAGTTTVTVAAEGVAMDMEIIFTDTDMWMSLGAAGQMLGLDAQWMHLDLAQLGADGAMGFGPGQGDPANAAALLDGLGDVVEIGERTYRVEVDLTQVDGSAFADSGVRDMLGDDATAWEFTATLDEEGRLASLSTELPAIEDLPAQTLTTRYFDYGAEVEVTPPPADQVAPAPDIIYGMIGA